MATDSIALFSSGATLLITASAATLRKSMSSVRGSGRVATYGTGSVASMTSDVPLLVTRELIVFRRIAGVAVAPELDSGLDADTSAPVNTTDRTRALPFITLTWRPRALATAFALLAV
jgi:hypothetical protein